MVPNALDDSTRKQYLADDPPTIVPLAIKQQFEALNDKEKKYAHYISRAAFSGTRVNLRQVSVESEAIYDFIVTLHKGCDGMCLLPDMCESEPLSKFLFLYGFDAVAGTW